MVRVVIVGLVLPIAFCLMHAFSFRGSITLHCRTVDGCGCDVLGVFGGLPMNSPLMFYFIL